MSANGWAWPTASFPRGGEGGQRRRRTGPRPAGAKSLTRPRAPHDARRMEPRRHSLAVEGPLDLPLTLSCGQAFRWRPEGTEGLWSGVVGAAEIRAAARGAA